MKALTFDPRSDRWVLRELPVPAIGDHDVLIRVHACGLNPVDAKIAHWKSMVPAMDNHWVAGLDVSGEIVQVGSSVVHWRVGDRVLTHGDMFRPHGGLAEYSVQDARTLIRHPGVTAELAAATPCSGWTAWRALHDKLRIGPGDTLLIAGGSGGVGTFAVQIARLAGVGMIVATTSTENADYVRSLGATRAVDYRTTDVIQAVHEISGGRGVTRGLDCVGGENARLVADSLGFEGEMVELVDVVEPVRYADAFMKGLSFHQLSLGSGHRSGEAGRATLIRAGTDFSAKLESGSLMVPRLRSITLDEAGATLIGMLDQRTVGKIVVRIVS